MIIKQIDAFINDATIPVTWTEVNGLKGIAMARRRYQRGQLVRKSNNWMGRWREDVADDAGAVKRVQRKEAIGTLAEFPTKRLAMRELDRRLETINSEDYRPTRRVTFGVFAERWMEKVLVHQKRSSQSSARSHIRVHLLPAFGRVGMGDIRMEAIQAFVTRSSQSPKTVKNIVTTMMSMWDTAQAWGYVQHSPFQRGASGRLLLKLPASRPAQTYHFTVEEALAIINKAQGRWKTFFRILAETGMRPGELAGLQITDCGICTLRVSQSVWGQRIQTPKSEAGVRTFAVSTSLAEELRILIASIPENRYGLVFVTEHRPNFRIDVREAERMRSQGYSWERMVEKIGVSKTSPKPFLHSTIKVFSSCASKYLFASQLQIEIVKRPLRGPNSCASVSALDAQ